MQRCDSPLKRGLGGFFNKTHKKRPSFSGESFKKCWVTYFLLGNGDGFGHDFLAIDHLNLLLHLFVD